MGLWGYKNDYKDWFTAINNKSAEVTYSSDKLINSSSNCFHFKLIKNEIKCLAHMETLFVFLLLCILVFVCEFVIISFSNELFDV